jgi:hypothetical protein
VVKAAKAYKARVTRFVRQSFGGCPTLPEGTTPCNPTARLSVNDDLEIVSVAMTPCGVASIDYAANAGFQRLVGRRLPPPPEDYPNFRSTIEEGLTVVFACAPLDE